MMPKWADETGAARPANRVPVVVIIAAVLVTALGATVLTGWHTGNSALIQVRPAFVAMQYNTALAFLLCGVGLLSLRRRPRISVACGTTVMAIALLTLVEYLAGVNIGIDELLMHHYIVVGASHPGRMAPNTTLAFLLSGAALVVASGTTRLRLHSPIASALASIAIALGAVAVFGYLIGAEGGYGWGQLTRMAVHTAAGFIVLGAGALVFSLHRHRAASRTSKILTDRHRIILLVAVMAAIAVGVTTLTLLALYEAALDQKRDDLTDAVTAQARMIEAIARFNTSRTPQGTASAVLEATLQQARDAHLRSAWRGASGEFTLARRQGDQIVFLLARRNAPPGQAAVVPLSSGLADPMRRALDGQSGVVVSLDYRGVSVLAAHEPIGELALGLVAKVDLAEIRAPFVKAGYLAAGAGSVLVFLGALLFLRIGTPLVERLQESERDHLDAQAIAHLGHWQASFTSPTVSASDELYRIFGMAPREVGRREDFVSLIHADDLPTLSAALQAAVDGTGPGDCEFRIVLPDGTEKHLSARSTVVYDGDARPSRMRGTAYDVTRQRQSERALQQAHDELEEQVSARTQELRESESQLIMAQRMARVGNWDWEPVSERLTWSDEVDTMFGVEQPQRGVTAPQLGSFVHPGDLDRVADLIRETLRDGTPNTFDHRIVRGDGRECTARTHVESIPGAGDEPAKLRGTIQDITQETVVEQQLRQAQNMESVGQLAGGIAHDFNNLLAGVAGYTELAVAGLEPDHPVTADLGKVLDLVAQAAEMTQQLLAFGRRQHLAVNVLNLGELVQSRLDIFGRLLTEEVEIELIATADASNIRADPTQMDQVLLNLIVNARSAMPDGGKLTFEIRNILRDQIPRTDVANMTADEYVLLVVTDTGCGMMPAVQARIFEPYFTTRPAGEGAGLGLSTVHGIVQQHHGGIVVESEPQAGTTFRIYLPRVHTETAELRAPVDSPVGTRGSETILLVEDDDYVREVAGRTLEAAGYRVLAASGAEQAEELFSRHGDGIDMLVTDVVMPNTDGPTLYQRLAKLAPSLPVLYVSGYAGTGHAARRALDPGVPLLAKPFSQQQLHDAVRNVLDARSTQ